MKISFDLEIPRRCTTDFCKRWNQGRGCNRFIRDLVQKALNQYLATFAESFLAIKVGAVSPLEFIEKSYTVGFNLADEQSKKYEKKENADNRA